MPSGVAAHRQTEAHRQTRGWSGAVGRELRPCVGARVEEVQVFQTAFCGRRWVAIEPTSNAALEGIMRRRYLSRTSTLSANVSCCIHGEYQAPLLRVLTIANIRFPNVLRQV